MDTVKRFNFTAQTFGTIGDGVTDCTFALQHAGRYVAESDYDAALSREAALREELDRTKKAYEAYGIDFDRSEEKAEDLQQRLTAAEQALIERNEFIKELIDEAGYDWLSSKAAEKMKAFIAALKPAEADPIQKLIDENPLAKNEAAQALLNRPKRWSEPSEEVGGNG